MNTTKLAIEKQTIEGIPVPGGSIALHMDAKTAHCVVRLINTAAGEWGPVRDADESAREDRRTLLAVAYEILMAV